jgi:hypothetical protein
MLRDQGVSDQAYISRISYDLRTNWQTVEACAVT